MKHIPDNKTELKVNPNNVFDMKDSTEKENYKSEDMVKKYTARDMLEAFRHGRKFELIEDNSEGELCGDIQDKHLPFWEWLHRY